jgi:hypothetical protein
VSTISARTPSVKSNPSRRKVYPPAALSSCTCTVRPAAPCDLCPAGLPGQVHVNGTAYALAYNATLPSTGQVIIHGYVLLKGDGKRYDVGPEGCDCPDAVFRSRACKHLLAIFHLIADGQIARISE